MVLFQVIDILFAVLRDLVIVLHVEIVICLLHNSDGISRAEYSLHFEDCVAMSISLKKCDSHFIAFIAVVTTFV